MRSLALILLGATTVLGAAAAAQAAQAAAGAQRPMVVELDLQSGGSKEALTKVFTELGAAPEKFKPVIDKHASGNGEKVLVTAGDQATCEHVAAKFVEIGMKAEVRALTAADVPSEYDGSDVVVTDQTILKELLQNANGQGVLAVFTAPWCGHCRTLVPELKSAASQLKAQGIAVAVINTDMNKELAAGLKVRMLPTIKWLQPLEDGNLAVAEYQGGREAASLVRFAQSAGEAIKEQIADASKDASKTATAASDAKAAAGSKIGQSKLGKSKAAGPDADGESKIGASRVKDSEVKEKAEASSAGEAAAGVQKAATPAEAETKTEEVSKPAAVAA